MKKTSNYNLNLYEVNDLANLTDGYNNSMNTLDTTVKTVSNSVAAETTRATKAESTLTTNLNTEVTRAKAAENTLTTNLNSEITRAKGAENTLTTNLNSEITRAKGAENTLNNMIFNKGFNRELPLVNFGAIDLKESRFADTQYPQGFCLVNDKFVCVLTNSTDSDADIVVTINAETGVIDNLYNVNWGHCNSISYNKTDGYIYVAPTTSYKSGETNVIYKVDPANMKTVGTIKLSVNPLNICFDNSNNVCYISVYISAEKINLYNLNINTKATTLIGSFNPNMPDSYGIYSTATSGTQNMACYKGNLWFLMGGDRGNYILKLNTQNSNVENIISFESSSFIYGIQEAQSIDFTNDGDLILFSVANLHNIDRSHANISFCNFYGGNINERNIYINCGRGHNAYVNKAFTSICKTGRSDAPFTSIYEAIAAIYYNYFNQIQLASDIETYNSTMYSGSQNLLIYLNGHTLTLNCNIECANLLINGNSGKVNVTKNIVIEAFTCLLLSITIVGTYTIAINKGVLNTIIVKDGVFDGYGHSCLIKTSTSTGKYSRFVLPTVS